MPTSSRTAQSGSTLRRVTMPCGPSENAGAALARSFCAGPAASIAITARRDARPNWRRRLRRTGSARARAALARDADQHGRQRGVGDHALLGDGERQRAAEPLGRGAAAAGAPDLGAHGVLDRALEGERRRVRTQRPRHDPRLCARAPATSPSTSTASTGPPAARSAHARAPVKPWVAPDVDTSTSVLRSSRARNRRASSSIAAVPDSSARPGRASESRCASTTIRRLDRPGRTPTTVSTSPSAAG